MRSLARVSLYGSIVGLALGVGGAALAVGALAPRPFERALPDPKLTPGVVAGFGPAVRDSVCTPGYTARIRSVPESEKRKVFDKYGVPDSLRNGAAFEIDHFVSLELGGTNALGNLWPETRDRSFRWNAWAKDRVENVLHRRVCSGAMTLEEAQRAIRTDWTYAFVAYVREEAR